MAALDGGDRAGRLLTELAGEPRLRLRGQQLDRTKRAHVAKRACSGDLSFGRSVREGPEDPGLRARSTEARERRDWKAAIRRYEYALRTDPRHAGAWNDLGLVYCEEREFAKARHSFEQALAADPEHPIANLNLAHLLREESRAWDKLHWRVQARLPD